VSKFGYLFVIKERSIWFINAQNPDPDAWEARRFQSGVGGVLGCGYTLQDIGTDVLFMSSNGNLQTLGDTERSGLYETRSLSAKQIRSYLRDLNYEEAASIIDYDRGWYILSAKQSGRNTNNVMVIYDFAKKMETPQGARPGNWYRAAEVYSGTTLDSISSRSCFATSRLLNNGIPTVVSGGATGRIFKENAGTKEELDDDETTNIKGWYVGRHMSLEDNAEFRLSHIHAAIIFNGQPVDSYVAVGAIVDPVEKFLSKVVHVDMLSAYDFPFYWNITNWNEGYWNMTSDAMSEAVIELRGRTFAAYVVMYGADAELYKMYATLEPGRV